MVASGKLHVGMKVDAKRVDIGNMSLMQLICKAYDVKPFQVVQDPRPEGVDPGDCVATEGVPGFRVVVTRQFFQGGSQVRTERLRTRYAPENEVRCGQDAGAR